MGLGDILFSFQGRINRAKYWLASLIPLALVGVVLCLPMARLPKAATVFLAVTLGIIVLAMALALGVKRLHDRDKSAWWLLIFYVLPIAFDCRQCHGPPRRALVAAHAHGCRAVDLGPGRARIHPRHQRIERVRARSPAAVRELPLQHALTLLATRATARPWIGAISSPASMVASAASRSGSRWVWWWPPRLPPMPSPSASRASG